MRYLSLFSGVGGFDRGFDQAGMTCLAQVEQDKHALSVLNYHWPNVPKIEDVRDVKRDTLNGSIELICGGFPCQDVSVAGHRAGLAGERSGLWFEFLRLIEEIKPLWVVIENVPGLLSSNRGRDMGTIVGSLAKCGYWWAYRVLDSQFFGVPQRRRRVFVVASLRRSAAQEILFERQSSPWDTPPSREAGENSAAIAVRRAQTSSGKLAPTLRGSGASTARQLGKEGDLNYYIMDTLRSGGDGGVPGSKWGEGLVLEDEVSGTLSARMGKNGAGANDNLNKLVVPDIAKTLLGTQNKLDAELKNYIAPTLSTKNEVASSSTQREKWYQQASEMFGLVRRLTPLECERLQGFPDNHTKYGLNEQGEVVEISDTQRYKQMGNAVSVPVAKWIGQRITAFESGDLCFQP